jgi:lysophospholipase L1-like esterase
MCSTRADNRGASQRVFHWELAMPHHQPARIVGPDALVQAQGGLAPDQFKFRVLTEGDSWFSMADLPLTVLSPSQLRALKFPGDALVVNCAQPGDELRNMVRWSASAAFRDLLQSGIGSGPELILLSGGGNDLINAADELILPFAQVGAGHAPADCVDAVKMRRFIDEYVKPSFRTIVQWRDAPGSASRGVPIVVHTYDYSMPRHAPAAVLLGTAGPWLFPVMQRKGIPVAEHLALSRYLLDQLADAILQLRDVEALPNFHVVDTRGVLAPAPSDPQASSDDWINEIHASASGYKKLYAQRWQPVLDALLI